jgi:hypothetical protein
MRFALPGRLWAILVGQLKNMLIVIHPENASPNILIRRKDQHDRI